MFDRNWEQIFGSIPYRSPYETMQCKCTLEQCLADVAAAEVGLAWNFGYEKKL